MLAQLATLTHELQRILRAPLFIGTCYVLAQLATLTHELAHAILPILEGETVTVSIGGWTSETTQIGRLRLGVASLSRPWVGEFRVEGQPDASIVALALGPTASLLLALTALGGLYRCTKDGRRAPLILAFAATWCLLQFAATTLPVKYPATWNSSYSGQVSDGRQILDRLRR